MSRRAVLLEALAGLRPAPASDDEPLELDSLGLVQLVEALEDRLGIVISAADVIPEHFGTVALAVRFLERAR